MMQMSIDWTALPPNYHANDPKTSKKAADKAEKFRVNHATRVLDGVTKHPGCNALELATHLGMGEYQVRRRLSELKSIGQVYILGARDGNSLWYAK